ncbi:helix-turn-helix transcriptional regulator, partial [Staphylococcus epidermidis]|uniref:helix-turn-helix domain-containing protein n=1 Tax=Staphylococcus epidermidis TaxID=1282 RepID=UPI0030C5F509
MSQEKLAEYLNVSRHSISNWEREVNLPDIQSLVEMTKLFNVSLNFLVKGEEMIVNKYVYAAL